MAELQDELEFNIGEEEDEATVEMNEDGTDAKVAEAEAKEKATEEAPNTEELENYSEKVQKRIDKLTARMREHQRREEAALEYARSVQKANEDLQVRYAKTNTERMGEARGRLDTQIMALKSVIKRAREEGDIDTETEAQQRLTSAVWEQQKLQEAEAQAKQQPAQQPKQQLPEQLRNRIPVPDAKAEDWAERNPWFGKNTVMTNTVYGIHTELVKNEGFDPASDEYYSEIDRRMRSIFPQAYEETPAQQTNRGNRPVQTVAPATRASGVNSTARRTIKLKPSEVAIAKKLGVPLEEYAKYVKR